MSIDLDSGAASLRYSGEERDDDGAVVAAMQEAVEGVGFEWKGYLYHQAQALGSMGSGMGEGNGAAAVDGEEEEDDEDGATGADGGVSLRELLSAGAQPHGMIRPPAPLDAAAASAAASELDVSGSSSSSSSIAAEVGLELRPAPPSSSSSSSSSSSNQQPHQNQQQDRASRNRARHALRGAPGVVCACVMAERPQGSKQGQAVLVARVRVRGGAAATDKLVAAVARAGFLARPIPSREAQERMWRMEAADEGGESDEPSVAAAAGVSAEAGGKALQAAASVGPVRGKGGKGGRSGGGGGGGGGVGHQGGVKKKTAGGKDHGEGGGGAGAGHLGDSKAVYDVKGMTCGACVSAIEGALRRAPGVVTAKVALLSEKAEVLFDSQATDAEALRARIEAVGYDATLLRAQREDGVRSLAAAVFELQRPPLTAREARSMRHGGRAGGNNRVAALLREAEEGSSGVSSPGSPASPATAFTGLKEGLAATEGVVAVELREPPPVASGHGDGDGGGGLLWGLGTLFGGLLSSSSSHRSSQRRWQHQHHRRAGAAAPVVAWAVVRYEPELVGLRDLVKAMRAQGYAARLLPHATVGGDGGPDGPPLAAGAAVLGLSAKQAQHLADARARLAACLWLAVPVTALAMAPQRTPWLDTPPITPGLRLRDILLLLFATLAQFGPGAVFYREAYKGLRGGSYGMALLVAMGTTAAWAFACFSLLRAWASQGRVDPYTDFFMTSAMLLSFILLGKVRGRIGLSCLGVAWHCVCGLVLLGALPPPFSLPRSLISHLRNHIHAHKTQKKTVPGAPGQEAHLHRAHQAHGPGPQDRPPAHAHRRGVIVVVVGGGGGGCGGGGVRGGDDPGGASADGGPTQGKVD